MAGRTQSRLADSDYEDVLQALSATTKGRLFLAEYLRRTRPQETRGLLKALKRVENNIDLLRSEVRQEHVGTEIRRIATTLSGAASLRAAGPEQAELHRSMLGKAGDDLLKLAESLLPAASTSSGPAPAEIPPTLSGATTLTAATGHAPRPAAATVTDERPADVFASAPEGEKGRYIEDDMLFFEAPARTVQAERR
ncbi:hypothetical protein SAMN05216548_10472 [Faunimonas pinastri]|uniref:Uncharacterized protein n=1 Tax=Faunimonas pinastri TaxID=1855383 RepID=A0A1H9FCB4_9HYPH|nr:hypothetical protein [Faunimonas pinastri]SEQ35547.1 hypothetical protein SAMN05216548_10472 [Faunimonas pinastri]